MDIYIIKNLINNKVYIGKTIHSTSSRWYQHLKHLDNGQYIHNAIKKYGVDNFYIEILETNIDNEETLNEKEKYWIAYYNSQVPNGYNIQEGGEKTWNKEIWQEWAKINPEKAQKIKNNFNNIQHLGVPALLEDRKSNPQKYYIHDIQSAQNLKNWREQNPEEAKIQAKKGYELGLKKWKEEHPDLYELKIQKIIQANKKKSKKVICITTGEIFESMAEAERITGVNHSHISQVCNGKRNYAGKTLDNQKRIWKFYDE